MLPTLLSAQAIYIFSHNELTLVIYYFRPCDIYFDLSGRSTSFMSSVVY